MPRSFIVTEKSAKNAAFFYKEQKRTQRTPHSFIKNGKEHKNVAFFWKERMPNPGGDLFGEPDSAILSLSLWAGEWHVWESDSASYMLSLWVVYIVIQGRLSKSLLSLWRRLSCPYNEYPCCVHIGGGVIVAAAQQLLAELVEGDWSSSSSANPYWVDGGSA